MKIGIYTPYLDTLSGGEKYILTAATALSKHHEVFLFWDKDTDGLKKNITEKFGMDLQGITFTDNIFASHVSFFSRFFASRSYDRIIVLSDGSIPLIGSKLFLHFQSPMEWVKGNDIKTKLKMSRVAKVICNSQYTKKFIDNTFGITSDVIYPPVVLGDTNPSEKENIILHVGRYGIAQAGSSYKKQEMLIAAFKKMIDAGLTGWKLSLIVSIFERDRERLSDLKKSLTGYPIELMVNPSNQQLWHMYSIAKIYWHASGFGEDLEKHPDRAEHFGMSTVEAMGCGAVPIVINAGGQPEIVTDQINGLLWNSEEELLKNTHTVIHDESLREKLSQAAKTKAGTFSITTFENQWEKEMV